MLYGLVKKNKMKKVLFLIICLGLTSCMDRFDNRPLTIENKSKNKIYGIIMNENSESYKDLNQMGIIISDSIMPNESHSKLGTKLWEDYIGLSKDKKMRLYVVEKDSVNKYEWKGIHDRNLYNKKYTLDIDDLDSLNWTIEYTGN